MKATQILIAAAAASVGSSFAFGFAEIERGELLLSTTARAVYDSRVFGGLNPADDYIFTLMPELLYRREAARLKLDGNVGLRFNRYFDFTELNSTDLFSSLKLQLPAEGATLSSGVFETSYDEHTDVNFDVNRRMREKIFITRLDSQIPTGLKTALLLAGSFRKEQRYQFSDRRTWDGTTGFRYMNFLGGSTFDITYRHLDVESTGAADVAGPIRQNTDQYSVAFSRSIYDDIRGSISYGYRILRRSQAEVAGIDNRSGGSIFSVNLVGPILPVSIFPKVESSLTLGYQKAETPGINDRGGTRLFGSGQVSWQARERTRLFVNGRRSQELSVNNLTVVTTAFNVGFTETIGNFTYTSASVGTETRTYPSLVRHDDVFVGQLGIRYRISKAWTSSLDYRLRAAHSNTTSANFTRHLVTLDLTYTF